MRSLRHGVFELRVIKSNHIIASLVGFVTLELYRVGLCLNHFALQGKVYQAAIVQAFSPLRQLTATSPNATIMLCDYHAVRLSCCNRVTSTDKLNLIGSPTGRRKRPVRLPKLALSFGHSRWSQQMVTAELIARLKGTDRTLAGASLWVCLASPARGSVLAGVVSVSRLDLRPVA